MTTTEGHHRLLARIDRHHRAGTFVGGFFLVMAGVHLGIVAADPQVYGPFADQSYFAFVRDGWREVVMAAPATWGLLLMTGELALGTALITGGRAARWGWAGAVAFHLLLLFFGWWVWLWCVPAIASLLQLARHDFVGGRDEEGRRSPLATDLRP